MPEDRPRIDSASLGVLRDAIKLIPEFNGDRESLDRYVVGLQEANEIIDPELDKHLLKLSKTKLSSSVRNKVSKITFDSVKKCTEYLKKIYDPSRDVYQLTGELGSTYQRYSDSVNDFADRVRGLSEKILEASRDKIFEYTVSLPSLPSIRNSIPLCQKVDTRILQKNTESLLTVYSGILTVCLVYGWYTLEYFTKSTESLLTVYSGVLTECLVYGWYTLEYF